MPTGHLPLEVCQAQLTGKTPQETPKTQQRDYWMGCICGSLNFFWPILPSVRDPATQLCEPDRVVATLNYKAKVKILLVLSKRQVRLG